MPKYAITRGVARTPVKAVVYGPEGVGKTTFAAAWPGAVFIDVEGGSSHYDVARMPRPQTWKQLIEIVNACASFPEIGTVIVDTADAAEALCIKHILNEKNWKGIEDAGFGKGYTYLGEEFSKLLHSLDGCVEAGKNALIVAHAQIRKFEQPDELGAYDRWELKLQKKCAPLVKEWSDLLLFANYKTDTMLDEKTKKYRATGGKRRIMYTSHTAAYDAKNRFGLPDEMPFEFDGLREYLPEGPAVEAAKPEPATEPPKPAKPAKKPKAAKPEPKQEPTSEPPTIDAGDGTNIEFEDATAPEFAELHRLMAANGVSARALQDAVGSRKNNRYTEITPIGDYDVKFVRTVLLAHWDKILETVRQRAEQFKDVPF